jgi:hypothetical protein
LLKIIHIIYNSGMEQFFGHDLFTPPLNFELLRFIPLKIELLTQKKKNIHIKIF